MNKFLLLLIILISGCATTQSPTVNKINNVVCVIPDELLIEPKVPQIPEIKDQKDLAIFLGSDVAVYLNTFKANLKSIKTVNDKCKEENTK